MRGTVSVIVLSVQVLPASRAHRSDPNCELSQTSSTLSEWLAVPDTKRTQMPHIPPFILDRLRQRPPANCGVVSDSTPVVSFGNPATARVATLGLNPSKNEFLDRSGELLQGDERRFETLKSLGLRSLGRADDATLEVLVTACHEYFHRNPYDRWFEPLDKIVQFDGASFFKGTACHLDLVQWATDPVWGKLSRATRRDLLEGDVGFLMQQLRHYPFEVLLLNGRGVISGFKKATDFAFKNSCRLSGPTHAPATLSFGRWESRLLVIGWSCNLQSSHGVTTKLREEIKNAVGEIARANA